MAEIMKEITASETERYMSAFFEELEKKYKELDSPMKRTGFANAANNLACKYLYQKSAAGSNLEIVSAK